jgi:D-galactarolactone cycloisomerase
MSPCSMILHGGYGQQRGQRPPIYGALNFPSDRVMQIVDIKTYALESVLEQPFAFSHGFVRKRSTTLVEVVTDEGLTGWGEAFNQGLEPPQISAAVVDHGLRPLLIGAEALSTEVNWHRMYGATRDYGRKGSVMAAISAVDIALWDIAGKALGVPIYQLLGGAFRQRVQAYATGFYRLGGAGEARRLADEALQHAEAGFSAMKIKLGFGLADDRAVMEEIRRALGERSVSLMIDTNHAYGVADAVRLGRALEPLNLRWYEEPVAPENLSGYREVKAAVNIPIAGGENEHSVYGFRDLIGQHCVDIVQPDIGSAGGFTSCRHVIALAHAHGLQVVPHVWGSAVGQAAALQLVAAIPVANYGLAATEPIFEYDCSRHPMRSSLVAEPVQQRDGWIEIPSRPGLGVEIDREAIQRYRIG